MVRQEVADAREKRYEKEGMGSCYMFRLDQRCIVDATRRGNVARFINHSCDPNAYSKVVAVHRPTERPESKKIIIFAMRELLAGEEVLYDYKFPFEEEEIVCNCTSIRMMDNMVTFR